MVPAASPAFSLIAVLWCLFTICAVLVESRNEPTVQRSSPPSPPQPSRIGSPPPPYPIGSPPPPLRKHEMNTGKKVGLLFVGISTILQIVVVGFLVYKRRQLLKVKDRFQTCS